ncbi:MAG: hypothetical protein EPO20_22305 [Betaproteobacteria bacterium]|nr:MAG: hypothetical protein EPO20_22305 [Betaproteobacteria bacterium]
MPAARVDEVRAQVEALLGSTLLAGAPVFALSSVSGEGVEPLLRHLQAAAAATLERQGGGNFRLSVDRAFTIAGAGLVVTGTALGGEIAVGDEVRALLAGSSERVRSIHGHNASAQRGRAGQRLALNLAELDKARIARGDWIVRDEPAPPVQRFDARLRFLEPVRHWTPVHVHHGAADVPGPVALLDGSGLAQLALERPVGAARGDGFIVRDQSERRTLGGGRVIDVFPPARGPARPERLAWLAAMELEDHAAALDALLALSPAGVNLARFAANRNLPTANGWRFSQPHWQALREKALHYLAAWHARFPDSVGMREDGVLKSLSKDVAATLLEELARGQDSARGARRAARFAPRRAQPRRRRAVEKGRAAARGAASAVNSGNRLRAEAGIESDRGHAVARRASSASRCACRRIVSSCPHS